MNQEPLISLLQFSDGLFPAGGFAHSFGLETYVQSGNIQTADEVETFMRAHLEGSLGPCDAVAVVAALALGRSGDLDGCFELDSILDAMKHAAEFRDASCQMGHQTLRIAVHLSSGSLLDNFLKRVERRQTPGHHAVVYGLTGSQFGWLPEAAATAYLFTATSLLVGAALRLLPLGQLEGQKIIRAIAPTISRLARQAQNKTTNDMWSFMPGIEIAGMKHATLEARLFRS